MGKWADPLSKISADAVEISASVLEFSNMNIPSRSGSHALLQHSTALISGLFRIM